MHLRTFIQILVLASSATFLAQCAKYKIGGKKGGSAPPAEIGEPKLETGLLNIEANPTQANVGQEVVFTATCEDNSNGITVVWNLGDGSAPVTEFYLKHAYNKPGDYTVEAICNRPGQPALADSVVVKVVQGVGTGGVPPVSQIPSQIR